MTLLPTVCCKITLAHVNYSYIDTCYRHKRFFYYTYEIFFECSNVETQHIKLNTRKRTSGLSIPLRFLQKDLSVFIRHLQLDTSCCLESSLKTSWGTFVPLHINRVKWKTPWIPEAGFSVFWWSEFVMHESILNQLIHWVQRTVGWTKPMRITIWDHLHEKKRIGINVHSPFLLSLSPAVICNWPYNIWPNNVLLNTYILEHEWVIWEETVFSKTWFRTWIFTRLWQILWF